MSLHHWINDGLMALFFFRCRPGIETRIAGGRTGEPAQCRYAHRGGDWRHGRACPDLFRHQPTRRRSGWLGDTHGHRHRLRHWHPGLAGKPGAQDPDHLSSSSGDCRRSGRGDGDCGVLHRHHCARSPGRHRRAVRFADGIQSGRHPQFHPLLRRRGGDVVRLAAIGCARHPGRHHGGLVGARDPKIRPGTFQCEGQGADEPF